LVAALRYPRSTPFKAMSRGEAAKVMLAAALIPSPQLVVLDESFARLAPDARDEVLEFFVREAPLDGGAALVATHDLDVAARLADRVYMLEDTKLTEVDDLDTGGGSVPARLRSLYGDTHEKALSG
jgi:ABC-type multidrug transport system ATPase subunit